MPYDPNVHHRRSIRLSGYDYAQHGAYFVTICTHDRQCLLGAVADGGMELNDLGRIVRDTWDALPLRFPTIQLDAFVVMPNHVHGIIIIVGAGPAPPNAADARAGPAPPNAADVRAGHPRPTAVGAGLALPTGAANSPPTLGDIIRAFKSLSAIACNRLLERAGVPFWQRNYYEHIVRDEDEMNRIREYIVGNPANWKRDAANPAHL